MERKSFRRTASGGVFFATRTRTKLRTSSLVRTSQMPSQANKMNSQSSFIVLDITSGAAGKQLEVFMYFFIAP